ncbi:hypothetical protein AAFN86_28195 [Roseomonas sp. CAU 1739]|uniref:hypothetical protein n=1 Tax=Roseomonas sp. CAU 1739 TaxID=3140364 RepID=UPI00325A84FE
MTAEQHTAPNPSETSRHARLAATFAAAPMRDLVTCARIFYAAIHVAGGRFSDDDFDALVAFDDFLSEKIAERNPLTAEDFAVKVQHLAGRIEDATLSDGPMAAAIAAIKVDAATAAELPRQETRA